MSHTNGLENVNQSKKGAHTKTHSSFKYTMMGAKPPITTP